MDQLANGDRYDGIWQFGLQHGLGRYLLRSIFMSTWGFLPAVFRPLRTVFPGLGAGFLNLAGKTEGTAKKWGKKRAKMGEKWPKKSGGKLT